MTNYAELRLRIDRGVGRGSYRITATGPAGEALGRFKLPFSDMELENFILKVGATRRGRRRIDSPEMELAKSFGTKLFGALFEGDVRELYRSSFSETRAAGQGLRVTLSLTGAPELLQVPWEYMYDHPSFLSISTWTPIVRYLDLPKPRRPLQVALPIRILALVSSPTDAEAIDAKQERAKLEAALGPLIKVGAIAIDWLEEASLRALQRQLRRGEYHVFHFIGHGGYDQDADDGVLLFEDEVGRGRRVSGIQLGTILADEVSLRLAVLNSCEGARSSVQDPFSGVATSLIEREIPAVIGMQFEITDRAAIVFAGEFYSALADGLPVDSSVAEARKAIYADQNDIEWGTPVLFMRVADGRLFDVQSHAPLRAPEVSLPATAADSVAPTATTEPASDAARSREPEDAEEVRLARAEAEAVEREREAAAALAAAEQLEKERREEERLAREAADAAERQRAEAEAQRLEAERVEQERLSREAADAAEREGAAAEAQRVEADRVAAERLEAERVEAERLEAERIAAAKVEAERVEQERRARDAAERTERERADAAERAAAISVAGALPSMASGAQSLTAQPAPATQRLSPAAASEASIPRTADSDQTAGSSEAVDVMPTAAPVPSEGRFSLGRAAARAALGSLIGLAMIWVWVGIVTSTFEGAQPDQLMGIFLNEAALTIVTMTAAVVLVERRWPAVRVPGGTIYGSLTENRWATTGIEGLVAGASVGWLTTVAFFLLSRNDDKFLSVGFFLVLAVFMGIGFVIAEAALHAFGPAGGAAGGSVASTPSAVEGKGTDRTSPATRDASTTREVGSEDHFSLPRAGARAALGSVVGLAMLWVFSRMVDDTNFVGVDGDVLVVNFVSEAVLTMITVTAAVVLIERLVPALRVPGGTAYGPVGHNRWAATAMEGLIAGGLVGWLTSLAFWQTRPGPDQFFWEALVGHAVFSGVGFLIAEAVLRAFRRRPSAA